MRPAGVPGAEFASPSAFWLLLAVAALAAAYVAAQLRRRTYAVRFTNLDLLDQVAPRRPGWWRHLGAGAFLVGLGALVVAAARPEAEVRVPRERATIMLAIDVSLSMEATDVSPTRLAAAQEAATRFVEELPDQINVGLVSFDGAAIVRVPPTLEHRRVTQAVAALELGPGTATGEAIFASLEAIELAPMGEDGAEPPPARIVLMSDGKLTMGRSNESAVQAAVEADVPVSTISFGTPFGEIAEPGSDRATPVPVEPAALEAIASGTGGRAFEASTLGELEDVYADIGSDLGYELETTDVTYRAVWVALGLMALAGLASLAWSPRLP
ncbi:MAG: VWA domain-containing protein [Acidimicrobiia bacterium]